MDQKQETHERLHAEFKSMLQGEELQKKIDDMPYPKVTAASIEAKIRKIDYLVLPDSTVTLCNITLNNGYSVRGESACVDPRNFNIEIGKGLAYKDAFGQLWALEGYLLAETRMEQNAKLGAVKRVTEAQEKRT